MSFSSPHPSIQIPEASLPRVVFGGLAEEDLTRTAIIDSATGHEVDYRRLRDLVAATAHDLGRSGLRAGDVVALLAPNSLEFPVFFHACGALGIAVTTVPVLAVAEDIGMQLRIAGATRIYAAPALLDAAAQGAAVAGLGPDAVYPLEVTDVVVDDDEQALPDGAFDPATQLMALPFSSGTDRKSVV